jgi:hypothetical protein
MQIKDEGKCEQLLSYCRYNARQLNALCMLHDICLMPGCQFGRSFGRSVCVCVCVFIHCVHALLKLTHTSRAISLA